MKAVRGRPGVYVIPELGKAYVLTESYEGDKYDSIELVPGAIAQAPFRFFQNVQNKSEIDTNLRTPGKIPQAEGMVLHRIGLYAHTCAGTAYPIGADLKAVYECGYFHFDLNQKTLAQGWVLAFPPGYGLAGMTNEINQCVISNGVASTAAAMTLLRPQDLTGKEHEIFAEVAYQNRPWLTNAAALLAPTLNNAVVLTCLLHGLIKAKATL